MEPALSDYIDFIHGEGCLTKRGSGKVRVRERDPGSLSLPIQVSVSDNRFKQHLHNGTNGIKRREKRTMFMLNAFQLKCN